MNDTLSYIQLIIQSIYYITYGFIFVEIIRFMSFKDSKSNFKLKFLCYVAVGILLTTIYEQIFSFTEKGSLLYICLSYLITILVAYFLGLLFSCNRLINFILLKLKIQRTPNSNIWKDMVEPYTELVVHLKDNEFCYVGDLVFIEENCRNPKIVLANYQLVRESDAKVVLDYDGVSDRRIMIDTGCIDFIEFIYNGSKKSDTDTKPKGHRCKRIKR